MQWCYARCEALAAPSITEGFGLPVAEALLAGCRSSVRIYPAYREVGDGHCRFVTLRKNAEEALAEAIVATLRNQRRRPISLPQFSRFAPCEAVRRSLSRARSVWRARFRTPGFPLRSRQQRQKGNLYETERSQSALQCREDEHGRPEWLRIGASIPKLSQSIAQRSGRRSRRELFRRAIAFCEISADFLTCAVGIIAAYFFFIFR